jgi:flagellar hook-length control protein FliK
MQQFNLTAFMLKNEIETHDFQSNKSNQKESTDNRGEHRSSRKIFAQTIEKLINKNNTSAAGDEYSRTSITNNTTPAREQKLANNIKDAQSVMLNKKHEKSNGKEDDSVLEQELAGSGNQINSSITDDKAQSEQLIMLLDNANKVLVNESELQVNENPPKTNIQAMAQDEAEKVKLSLKLDQIKSGADQKFSLGNEIEKVFANHTQIANVPTARGDKELMGNNTFEAENSSLVKTGQFNESNKNTFEESVKEQVLKGGINERAALQQEQYQRESLKALNEQEIETPNGSVKAGNNVFTDNGRLHNFFEKDEEKTNKQLESESYKNKEVRANNLNFSNSQSLNSVSKSDSQQIITTEQINPSIKPLSLFENTLKGEISLERARKENTYKTTEAAIQNNLINMSNNMNEVGATKVGTGQLHQETISVLRQDFAQAVKDKIMVVISQKLQRFEINLDPPELGNVQVRVNLQGEQAAVNFTVNNTSTKDMLETSMNKLKEMLAQEGMDLVETNVEQGNDAEQQHTSDSSILETAQIGESSEEEIELLSFSANAFNQEINGIDYYA